MVLDIGMQLIRQFGFLLCLFGLAMVTSCDDKKRETVFTDFLSEHDPVLKSKRDEIVTLIAEIKEKRDRLQTAKKQYKSEAARIEMEVMIQKVDWELEKLQSKLAAIDSKIELAMVARDIRSADAGGLRTAESKELSENADAVLQQAGELRNLLADENRTSDKSKIMASERNQGSSRPTPKHPGTTGKKEATTGYANVKSDLIKEHSKLSDSRNAEAGTKLKLTDRSAQTSNNTLNGEALERELRRLEASISNNEANLNQAWARINQITRNGTVPIVKGSRQHVEYLSAQRVLEDCQIELPKLRNRRDELKEKLESK